MSQVVITLLISNIPWPWWALYETEVHLEADSERNSVL